MTAADLELVRAVRRGDAAALQRFIERMDCVPRILSVLNARSGRRLKDHDLRDVVQDTLMAVWRKLDRFEGRASLDTWAYRFCVQEMLAAVRRRRRQPLPMSDLDAGLAGAIVGRAIYEGRFTLPDALVAV